MSSKVLIEGSRATAEPDGFHPAENVTVPHTHFNVLKIVKSAQEDFIAKFAGAKVPKYFHAPEAFLFLVDKAIKDMAETIGQPVPEGSFVNNIYGMELVSVIGTCITITEEEIENKVPEPRTFTVPGAVGQA